MTPVPSVFVNLLEMLEALPPAHHIADETPLRNHLPGVWPTMRDLRELCQRANIVRKP